MQKFAFIEYKSGKVTNLSAGFHYLNDVILKTSNADIQFIAILAEALNEFIIIILGPLGSRLPSPEASSRLVRGPTLIDTMRLVRSTSLSDLVTVRSPEYAILGQTVHLYCNFTLPQGHTNFYSLKVRQDRYGGGS